MNLNDNLMDAIILLSEKPLLRDVSGLSLVVGDIHGDHDALIRALKLKEEYSCDNLILLGDYVDRGAEQIKVVTKLVSLINSDPSIIPLRGNHEDIVISRRYGFMGLAEDQNIDLELISLFFSHLPIAALSKAVFFVHGGIPVNDKFSIKDIDHLSRIPIISDGVHAELLWNDPLFENEDIAYKQSRRGPNYYEFGTLVTEKFLERHGLKLVVRAHSYLPEGYRWAHDKRILSIFSSNGGPYKKVRRHVAVIDEKGDNVDLIEL